MIKHFITACLFFAAAVAAQPRLELTPAGFAPVDIELPPTTNEKLIELSRNWAMEYNRPRKERYDITNVTGNSMTISAFKDNAFYYTNRGEEFYHRIRYSIELAFYGDRYTVVFTVVDIYADDDKIIEYKIPDYFNSNGKLKEGYEFIEPSLEATVNSIVGSHYNFIINYR